MNANACGKQPVSLVKSAIHTLVEKPIVLFPFSIVIFIQLLIFELIFFAPRQPLVNFFGPIIRRLAGEAYLHYPFNFAVLSNWFQNTFVQGAIFIIVNVYCLGVLVAIVNEVNSERPIHLAVFFRKVRAMYIHLFAAGLIVVGSMYALAGLHGLIIKRALLIRSNGGKFFLIKQLVLLSAPYINLILAIFVTTLFIFVIPIIVLEKKKIISALVLNFKMLWGNFWFSFSALLLPALIFIPLIILRSNSAAIQKLVAPELWIWVAIIGMFLSVLVDAVQYTAITTFYLLRKEAK